MNTAGIIKGGIAGGLLILVSHYILHSVEAGHEGGEGSIVFWVGYSLAAGILIAYLYAVARPRWGAGIKSAACAGIMVWILHECMPALGLANMGVAHLDLLHLVWSAADNTLAGIVAGKLYSES